MEKYLVALVVLVVCLFCLTAAQDVESIKQQIIAQYEQIGGSSVHHPEEIADVIDPANIQIRI